MSATNVQARMPKANVCDDSASTNVFQTTVQARMSATKVYDECRWRMSFRLYVFWRI